MFCAIFQSWRAFYDQLRQATWCSRIRWLNIFYQTGKRKITGQGVMPCLCGPILDSCKASFWMMQLGDFAAFFYRPKQAAFRKPAISAFLANSLNVGSRGGTPALRTAPSMRPVRQRQNRMNIKQFMGCSRTALERVRPTWWLSQSERVSRGHICLNLVRKLLRGQQFDHQPMINVDHGWKGMREEVTNEIDRNIEFSTLSHTSLF